MNTVTIPDSERLTYRLMDANDTELMWQLDQDVEVMRHINGGKITSKEEIRNIMLPRMKAYRNAEKGWGLWQVSTKEDKQYLGWILVRPMNYFNDKRDDADLELGWRFHQKSWGFGYATEAALAVMNAICIQTKVRQFSAIAVKENLASINIMKKLGMSFVKRELYEDPLIDSVVDYYTIENYSAK